MQHLLLGPHWHTATRNVLWGGGDKQLLCVGLQTWGKHLAWASIRLVFSIFMRACAITTPRSWACNDTLMFQ